MKPILTTRISCIRAAWLAIAYFAALSGCQAGGGDAEIAGAGSGVGSGNAASIDRLTRRDNGLELRQWAILDEWEPLGNIIARYQSGVPLDAGMQQQFVRNGLRLVQIPAVELDNLLDALGTPRLNVTSWHGQIFEWSTLHDIDLEQSTTVAIDGRVRRLPPGELRIVARSWTVQMEDGPQVQLELVPEFMPETETQLRDLLEPKPWPGERFESLAVDLALEDGMAYLLTTAAPDEVWIAEAGEQGEPQPAPAADERPRQFDATPQGPADVVGPETFTPTTLGELMLGSDTQPTTRGMLIFVPKISADLYPPPLGSTGRAEPTSSDSNGGGSS